MSRSELQAGEEVQITGGAFAGRTGVVEEILPSGKLRVRVELLRSVANARIDPAWVEPRDLPVEEVEEDGGA